MEEWKDIPGYEGIYQASSLGQIRSVDRYTQQKNRWGTISNNFIKGRLLAQTKSEPAVGYLRYEVKLSKEGKAKTKIVSQVIALTFIGPRPAGVQVAHWDGNSLNNRKDNLRYASAKENTHDKFRHGTMLRGSRVGTSKLSEDQVRHIISMRGKCRLIELAEKYGVRESLISRIQTGKRWRHLHENVEASSAQGN